jgi:hypothetical protein
MVFTWKRTFNKSSFQDVLLESKLIFSDLHYIDILIETKNIQISDLRARDQILKLDSRFVIEGFKLYFVKVGHFFLTEISYYTLCLNAWMICCRNLA